MSEQKDRRENPEREAQRNPLSIFTPEELGVLREEALQLRWLSEQGPEAEFHREVQKHFEALARKEERQARRKKRRVK